MNAFRSAVRSLVPAWLRRLIVDSIYGSKSTLGMWVYFALLALLWIIIAAWATGNLTDWPLKAHAKIETFVGDSCEALDFASHREAAPTGDNLSVTANQADAGSSCSDASEGERRQLDQARDLAENLRQGTPKQIVEFDAPDGSALQTWMNSYVCKLGGAGSVSGRAGLGWYVRNDVGKCPSASRLVAGFPFTVWFGYWLGLLLTPLVIGAATIVLIRHGSKIPSTRVAYRRLYGSHHKPPSYGSGPRSP
jgi:hypothetical protein